MGISSDIKTWLFFVTIFFINICKNLNIGFDNIQNFELTIVLDLLFSETVSTKIMKGPKEEKYTCSYSETS